MSERYHNPNLGMSPQDPAWDPDFDPEGSYERYVDECERREEMRREERV